MPCFVSQLIKMSFGVWEYWSNGVTGFRISDWTYLQSDMTQAAFRNPQSQIRNPSLQYSIIPLFHYSTIVRVKHYTYARKLALALQLELPEEEPVLRLIQPRDAFLCGRLYGHAVIFNRKM